MNNKKIKLGVMLIWLAGIILIMQSTGEAPSPPTLGIMTATTPPASTVTEIPLNELQAFLPCRNGQTAGQGTFQNWRSHYDDQGHYIILIPFEGHLGDYTPHLNLVATGVAYVDFYGTWEWTQEKIWEKNGPVRFTHLGKHKEFIRLSINFNEKEIPAAVSVEVLHKDQVLALRFIFTQKEPDKK